MTQVMPVTDARRQLLDLVDLVDEHYSRVDFTKHGRIKAALVSSDYLDSLEETVYSLTNSLSDIKFAQKDITAGRFITLDQVKKRFAKNVR